jgi:hypothetical protein
MLLSAAERAPHAGPARCGDREYAVAFALELRPQIALARCLNRARYDLSGRGA